MRNILRVVCCLVLFVVPALAQARRLWVLRAPDALVEYDAATFAAKQTVKVPAEALNAPGSLAVSQLGQILFTPALSLPLTDEDLAAGPKLWIWNGHEASHIDLGLKREMAATGSNQAITELLPTPFLSADGSYLYWFANQERLLQREGMDLSVTTTWQAWRTDLHGSGREDLATVKLPDCRCPTGSCEESCPTGVVWVPDNRVDKYFLMTQFVANKDEPVYKASSLYQEQAGKWTGTPLPEPLRRVLDAASGGEVIVEAIPDTACCGSSNESDDQTLVLGAGKKIAVFDEQATYKNPDYDVSFFTSNASLSPQRGFVAMTIASTAQTNQPFQLAEQGQANPEESRQIRKALTELPAVEVKGVEDSPRQIAFIPHASLIGWISEREVLIVEDHVLVAYNVETGARRKSTVRVEDVARVYLR